MRLLLSLSMVVASSEWRATGPRSSIAEHSLAMAVLFGLGPLLVGLRN